jgi:hypothetical protein
VPPNPGTSRWLEQAMLRFEDEDDERVAVEATINQARHLLVSKIM